MMNAYHPNHVSAIDAASLAAVEANLDFSTLEEACGLSFNDDARYKLKEAACEYLNAKETFRHIGTKAARDYCKEIVEAVDVLMPVLTVLGNDKSDLGTHDPVIIGAVWHETIPHAINSADCEEHVRRYLKLWRERALEAQGVTGDAGRPPNQALRIFLHDYLHPIYIKAGGTGRGSHYDDAKGHHVGAFYNLALAMLRQIDPSNASESALPIIIKKVIPAA